MINKSDLKIMDTHAHLDMPHFDADRQEVIKRAQDAGVSLINTIGIDVESSRRCIQLTEKYSGVVASIGIHPQEAGNVTEKDIRILQEVAGYPGVVAIGELGLDFFHREPSREAQIRVLRWELELAAKAKLPVIVHCRQAREDMMAIIADWCESYSIADNTFRGVLHCFSGDIQTADWYIQKGFFISIGAYVSYPSSAKLRETVSNLPLEKLVVETDSPFLPPQKYRGQRNEPSYSVLDIFINIPVFSLIFVFKR